VISEINIDGVFLHGALACAILAGICLVITRKLLGTVGAYTYFINPGLIDICLFVLYWGLWTWLISK
jgi:hypothetical protein